ncbi:MAG: site-specific DNA-methyltransferase [Robiginitomaculum sp.]|nr:MAG: site-specific DNA-methyltransferase [Robiginitomaculum sp.]
METRAKTYTGDCLNVMQTLPPESVDLIYIDPPFFTQRKHDLTTRDGSQHFSFKDIWENDDSYADFIYQRIIHARTLLKETGALFFHCDKSAAHIVRIVLDKIFKPDNFQSEIIWHFKRWSNAKKGLLSSHQTIFFYSKSKIFKFNKIYKGYSPSTNVDQIMQKRVRDARNKPVYARNKNGKIIGSGTKKGVPLSDVWDIPFLNPKAKERTGYPTQKPVLLLNQIIELVTEEGDVVLDPFCGSGTTLVAASLLKRHSIGIDVSEKAILLSKSRLKNPIVTESSLLKKGIESYRQHASDASDHLVGIDYTPVHRNKGIDGLLKQEVDGLPAFIRVQRNNETLSQAVHALKSASENKGQCSLIVVATSHDLLGYDEKVDVHIIKSANYALTELIKTQKEVETTNSDARKLFQKVRIA